MIYEYECRHGHRREELRKIADRDARADCQTCLEPMTRVMSVPAKRTDGIYSYAPNIGDPNTHERRNAGIQPELPKS